MRDDPEKQTGVPMFNDVHTGNDMFLIANFPNVMYMLADLQLHRLGMRVRQQKKEEWVRTTEEGAQWYSEVGSQRILDRLRREK